MGRTAVEVRSFQAEVAAAQAEVDTISEYRAEKTAALCAVQTEQQAVESEIQEVRIAEAMGQVSEKGIAVLKARRAELVEEVEIAQSHCIAGERRLEQAERHLRDAHAARHQALEAFIRAEVQQCIARIKTCAVELAAAQRECIAIARGANKAGIKHEISTYILFARIESEVGGNKDQWPSMGDRRIPSELIAPRMSEIQTALDSL